MATSSTSVKLETELKERVQKLALARKRTSHWLMKEAIEQYVAREEVREADIRDARASWEHYKATGLHLTFEEMDDWLAKLEAGNDAELPACHT